MKMKLLANLRLRLRNIVIWCKLEKTIELEKHFQSIFREYETISMFNGLYRIDVESFEKTVVTMLVQFGSIWLSLAQFCLVGSIFFV